MTNDLEFGPDSDEDLPEQVLSDIEDGMPPVTALRHWRELTVDQLADRAGKIAKALGASVDLLLE